MTSILDITPTVKKVTLSKFGQVDVPGITLKGLVQLLKSHPELIPIFQGTMKQEELSMDLLTKLGVEVTYSFMMVGLGMDCADKKSREKIELLNPEDLLDLGEAIIEQSFPGGIQSFFARLAKAAERLPAQDLLPKKAS